MSGMEELPLDPEELSAIRMGVVAGEAIDLWKGGMDFKDMVEDPDFLEKGARVCSDGFESTEDYKSTLEDPEMQDVLAIFDGLERLLLERGKSPEEAKRIVKAEILRALILDQVEREE